MSADGREPSKLPADQLYLIDQATYLAARADSASVRKWEWAAFGSLLLFVYLAFVSPPWQAIKVIDVFVIALVFGASAVLVAFERHLEKESTTLSKLSMKQFRLAELAAKDASVAQSPVGRNQSAVESGGTAP